MTNALIAEARRRTAPFVYDRDLAARLADALEASEAQVARLRATLHEFNIFTADIPEWPADLLAAVWHFTEANHTHADGADTCEAARATLRRYGLLPKEGADVVAE